jgi:short-subunit dehydrogenase
MDLSGKRVLVTGASRGIGAELVRAFAAAGARPALVARSRDAIEKLAADVGGNAYAADLADRDVVAGLLDQVERDGEVDVLVNNAGVDDTGHFTAAAPDDIERLLRLNLTTPIELCRQAVTRMVPRGRGHVVNVSSLAAVIPFPGLTVYGASKAGLSRFTAGLRGELQGTGVGTTLVEVGGVRTEMVDNTRTFAPTKRAWDRFETLRLSVDIDPDAVARHVVRAVQRDRATVLLPRRALPYPWLAQAPWHITKLLLTGVDRQAEGTEGRT